MPTDKELAEERLTRREEQKADCRLVVSLGNEARSLLDSRIWSEELEPFLRKEQRQAALSSLWRASSDRRTLDEVALNGAYLGGGVDAIEALCDHIKAMAKDGQEARDKLKRLEEMK